MHRASPPEPTWADLRPIIVALGVVAQLFLGTGAGAAVRQVLTCETALAEVQKKIGTFESDVWWDTTIPTESTVTQIQSRPGPHGGRILVYQRNGLRWASNFSTVGFDPQGDPRWFISAAGKNTAAFFGFRMVGDRRCEVPDAQEFNGALAALNARLVALNHEPVAITYYQTPNNENVKVEDYVKRFRDDAGIPLAHSDNHLLHDLSFHTASIFLPSALVRYKRAETKFIEDFGEHLAKKYAADPDRAAAVRTYRFYWRAYQTYSIDNGTGLLAPALVAHAEIPASDSNRSERRLNLLHAPIDWMTSKGRSPYDVTKGLINDFDGHSERRELVKQSERSQQKMKLAVQHLPTSMVRSDLLDFTRNITPPADFELAWANPYDGILAKDRLCEETTQRRAVIDAIARDLLSSMSPLGWGRALLRRFF